MYGKNIQVRILLDTRVREEGVVYILYRHSFDLRQYLSAH